MKTTQILNCLMLLIPFNVFAHPGHADTGFSTGQILAVAMLAGLGAVIAVTRLYRRRKIVRADD